MDETFESEREGKREQSRLLGRVFGYMALGLGVTAIVSLIVSLIFAGWISKDPSLEQEKIIQDFLASIAEILAEDTPTD